MVVTANRRINWGFRERASLIQAVQKKQNEAHVLMERIR